MRRGTWSAPVQVLRASSGQDRGAQAREAAAAGQAALIEPEREFIICALDLVSGLAEGLGAGLEALVGRSLLRPLLVQCCQDPSADVRQSAFALVGDLSKACQPHLAPIAGDLIALGVASLQPAMIRQVCAASRRLRCTTISVQLPAWRRKRRWCLRS